ncbi:MAG TPA: arginase family protein [Candidatus Bathyarchaeia archaeon]|nr:arginase family protein [Candidatus Bathyarchaeia archaeon]
MSDRRLITPFFLDRPSVPHRGLPGDWLNDLTLHDGPLVKRLSAVHDPLAAEVARTLDAGDRPVSIAGDCCAVIPVIAGLQRAGVAPRLLWLDAHGDFNTPETTPSGFIGGMPLAMLVGRGDLDLLRALGLTPIPERDVILCDARDLDPGEREAVEGSEVRRVPSLAAILEQELSDRPLHVHLDVDVMSTEDAPAVLYPVAGGPRCSELVELGRKLAARGAPVSVSMTTWVFDRDADGRTAEACTTALEGLLAKER